MFFFAFLFCKSPMLLPFTLTGRCAVVVVALLVAVVAAAAAVIVALIVVVAIDMVVRRALCSCPLHRVCRCQIEALLLLVCACHWQSTRCFAIWRWFQFTLYTTCTQVRESFGGFSPQTKKTNEIMNTRAKCVAKKGLQTVHSSGQRTRVTEMKRLKERMNERAFIRVHKWHKMRRICRFFILVYCQFLQLCRWRWQCYLHCSRCIGKCACVCVARMMISDVWFRFYVYYARWHD